MVKVDSNLTVSPVEMITMESIVVQKSATNARHERCKATAILKKYRQ